MIDNKTLDELADKLSSALPDSIQIMQHDIERNMRAILESTFQKMNLVSREEFDVQVALLAKTEQRLKELEQQIAELEKK